MNENLLCHLLIYQTNLMLMELFLLKNILRSNDLLKVLDNSLPTIPLENKSNSVNVIVKTSDTNVCDVDSSDSDSDNEEIDCIDLSQQKSACILLK